MLSRIRKSFAVGLLALVCALAVAAPLAAQSTAQVIQQVKFEQRIGNPLPLELTFRDEAGETVQLARYFGKKPVVVALVYYECPMLCTFILNGLVKSLKPLAFEPGREFEIVVVSFNPRETPQLAAQKKQTYLEEYKRVHTWAGWHFLTGQKANLDLALTKLGQYVNNRDDHLTVIIIGNERTGLWKKAFGLARPEELIKVVESVLSDPGAPPEKLRS